jgi:hypothetical protein
MPNVSSAALRKRRRQLVRGLPQIAQILRGSLIETYKRCGRPNCHCIDGPGQSKNFRRLPLGITINADDFNSVEVCHE